MKCHDEPMPLFEQTEDHEPKVALPTMPMAREVSTDYHMAGLSLKRHPLALIRRELASMQIITAAELEAAEAGQWVRVAGLVLVRQRPGTASGIVFETLEDETGVVNLIIRPDIYEKYRHAARHAGLVVAQGFVERQGQVIHIMAKQLHDLSALLHDHPANSRDFH